jgi:omega-6 fatty acid desaturase / acyl-lipid omega-6 desaturase (Delta-12 desaturase)
MGLSFMRLMGCLCFCSFLGSGSCSLVQNIAYLKTKLVCFSLNHTLRSQTFCLHHAFSEHAALDDAVGFALHTALLVPYFSTGSTATGGGGRRSLHPLARRVHGTAAGCLAVPVSSSPSGGRCTWRTCKAAGRLYPRFASHYDDPLPPDLHHPPGARAGGRSSPVLASWPSHSRCGAPLLVVNAWLVLLTYLQQTDPPCRGTSAASGTGSIRGALATVDRDYGALLNAACSTTSLTRTCCCTTFSRPCRTTTPPRPVLGASTTYRFDATPVVHAVWRAATRFRARRFRLLVPGGPDRSFRLG